MRSDGEEASDGSDSYELISSSYATSRDGASSSSDAELENALLQRGEGSNCGGSPQLGARFAELGASFDDSMSSLEAFTQQLLSPAVAAAHTALEKGRLHPLFPCNLRSTAAGRQGAAGHLVR